MPIRRAMRVVSICSSLLLQLERVGRRSTKEVKLYMKEMDPLESGCLDEMVTSNELSRLYPVLNDDIMIATISRL
jgi:hypothetical protein